ncbi:MAG: Hsp33 family molecular chaperone HslO [Oscillospiraceae bacterium]|nr:Hsp33 family molecular chaperone HslO [Oscillospiraceae bacterium]
MSNNLIRYITHDGSAVIACLDSTEIVRRMEQLHRTSATASAALGRVLTAAALMGCGLKDPGNTLTLSIRGNGPMGNITAVSDWKGNVRGCADDVTVELPINEIGKLDVGGAVGRDGTLYVVRDVGMDTPYVGQIALVSGEIAEDVTEYYAVSEQIPTVCALGVLVDTDLSIKCAGGFLLQLLPGAEEETVAQLEENISKLPSVTAMMEGGMSLHDIALAVLHGLQPDELDGWEAQYQCTCSRERMERVLISLGKEELQRLAEEQPSTEIVCHFCNSKYTFTSEEMFALCAESNVQ